MTAVCIDYKKLVVQVMCFPCGNKKGILLYRFKAAKQWTLFQVIEHEQPAKRLVFLYLDSQYYASISWIEQLFFMVITHQLVSSH